MTSKINFSKRVLTLVTLAMMLAGCGGGSIQDAGLGQHSGAGVGSLAFEAPPTPGKPPNGTGN
jgi:hypothetical protein